MFNSIQRIRKILLLLIDVGLISLAVLLAFLLRFEGQISSQQFLNVLGMICVALLVSFPAFFSFRLYSFSWTYVSTSELILLVKAIALSFLLSGVILFILRDQQIFQGFPRSTFFISYILIFLFCGAIRLSKRLYLQIFRKGLEEKSRTLIVGVNDAGEQIARSALLLKNSPYFPVGFVDEDRLKRGEIIHGIRVLGGIDDIPTIVRDNQIEQMIIALPSAGTAVIKKAVERGREAGLKKIKYLPLVEIIDGISLRDLREVQIGDLLQRKPVVLDTKLIKNFIFGKSVLITGAAGSIGSELCRQVAKFNPSLLLLLDQDETGIFNISEELKGKLPKLNFSSIISDIQEERKIDKIFNQFRPNIVFHAAAYKHVPLMEEHPDEAVRNNIFGTKIVAEASLRAGVESFIFISTDKAVNPVSVMGITKRMGEMMCQALNQKNFTPYRVAEGESGAGGTKFISVRFGNVLDSRGSVIPIFREQIKKGGPVEVTHPEMKRYFMVISESCLLVMQAGAIGEGGEVFVLDMGEPIKILDLAKEMIKFSGFEPDKDIPIVFTEPRPGEKLFEEILTAEEGTMATQNQNIFRARLSPVNEQTLNECLGRLKNVVEISGKEEITNTLKNTLKQLIPSHKS